MVGKPQKRTEQTRKTILSTARKLFDSAGYDATSVEQIALAAGFAKGTIFSHFPDKANLLTAVRIDQLETLVEQMNARLNTPTHPNIVEVFLDILNPWLSLFARDHDFTHVFLNQADLRGGSSAMRLYEVCCALDSALEKTTATLIDEQRLPDTISVSLYAQGIQAFFYHVLIGLHSGATANQSDQQILLRGLLSRWLEPAQ
ncbi:MAG: TetR/AcrR family transcriptional regulator [Devosiaceae bacterium]|nr:TetR/AcrR family transcriptional regulator [Devosiaceae bacterium]